MTYALLILFAVVFLELFVLLRMSRDAKSIITLTGEAVRVLVASEIGDDEKEGRVRRASAQIVKATFRFALKFLAIGLFVHFLFLLSVAHSPDLRGRLLESLMSPAAIAMLTAVIVCYALVRRAIRIRL